MLAFERAIGKDSFYSALPKHLKVGITFLIVTLAWVFFRSPDMAHACGYIAAMFGSGQVTDASADGSGAEGQLTMAQMLTSVEEASDFVEATGVDALAIAVGTSHGAYKFSRPPTGDILAIERIKAIHANDCRTHTWSCTGRSSVPQDWLAEINEFGGEIPETYGVPVEEIQEGIKHGVRKVNIDTDLRLASTGATRKFLAENKSEFDPRKFLIPTMDAMKSIVLERLEAFGTAGQISNIKKVYNLEQMADRYSK